MAGPVAGAWRVSELFEADEAQAAFGEGLLRPVFDALGPERVAPILLRRSHATLPPLQARASMIGGGVARRRIPGCRASRADRPVARARGRCRWVLHACWTADVCPTCGHLLERAFVEEGSPCCGAPAPAKEALAEDGRDRSPPES